MRVNGSSSMPEAVPQVSRAVRPAVSPARFFHDGHPLAGVARARCSEAGHMRGRSGQPVACGSCWEVAVRDDERFVVECGLPRRLVRDPGDIDEIAVALACAGRRVRLTPVELTAAVLQLKAQGWSGGRIAGRLGRNSTDVRRIMDAHAFRGAALKARAAGSAGAAA